MTDRGSCNGARAEVRGNYGVTTKAFNQSVKRNEKRFPPDFRFQLTQVERDEVVTNCDHLRGLRFSAVRPWAFTEHGAIMAASVLNSSRAVEMSVFVVRAFLRLREFARTRAELAAKLAVVERRVGGHDAKLRQVFTALRAFLEPVGKPHRQIGFTPKIRG
ncbi:MAG: hypothetical protein A3G76_11460 [Acidobacteria bacterium RIFCSPLOWO2_12_FULL_65_11]|nr:MAG: hypothetical protein A3H95_10075 [Acidobacteria bacterium RIFCSPLOWO2_02_FULL_64_15]OFW29235.1 MAG: hypothetical protein A3G76_11460 [Acidobacteria bacterium RIFCSPLOWO2_12_FULL_65_11]